jgi:integrase/recombinase XerD
LVDGKGRLKVSDNEPIVLPKFRSLKFDDWPDVDRRLFEQAGKPGTLFRPGGLASTWRVATLDTVIHRYGTFLWWLRETARLRPEEPPMARATSENVEPFIAAYQPGHAPNSLLAVVHGTHEAIRVMHPDADLSALALAVSRIKAVAKPRPKLPRMADHGPLIALAEAMIEYGAKRVTEGNMLSAAKVRDGALILFLVECPIRRANIEGLRIGHSLLRDNEGYVVDFDADQTKTRAPLEVVLSPDLSAVLDYYVKVARPVLAARANKVDEGWLWLGAEGLPMTGKSLSRRVRELVDEHLGRAMSAHLFRDAAATTVALRNPALIGILADVLGHARLETSERYYNQARRIDACRRYQEFLGRRRTRGPSDYLGEVEHGESGKGQQSAYGTEGSDAARF